MFEKIEGQSLSHLLETNALNDEERLNLVNQLVDVVSYLHSQGIVHRDIKPDNIIVTKDGQLKLIDFGIYGEEEEKYTIPAGTPRYAAPEQIKENGRVKKSMDTYAVAAVTYELITNMFWHSQYDSETQAKMIRSNVPEPLQGFFHAALEKNPGKRKYSQGLFSRRRNLANIDDFKQTLSELLNQQ